MKQTNGPETVTIGLVNRSNSPIDDSDAELIPDIRPTVRAVIVQRQHILLLRKDYGEPGERFALPGGGQEPGETLHETLQRECQEEIATRVEIGPMLHAADFFKLRDTEPPTRRHLLELLFRCQVPADYIPRNGYHPDKHQVDVIWAELSQVPDMPLFPPYLVECIARLDEPQRPFYLGGF
jgi:ADP-ribose pyrophosphatase YjhB (NUDIX family)